MLFETDRCENRCNLAILADELHEGCTWGGAADRNVDANRYTLRFYKGLLGITNMLSLNLCCSGKARTMSKRNQSGGGLFHKIILFSFQGCTSLNASKQLTGMIGRQGTL